jgi:hypothetical protein
MGLSVTIVKGLRRISSAGGLIPAEGGGGAPNFDNYPRLAAGHGTKTGAFN